VDGAEKMDLNQKQLALRFPRTGIRNACTVVIVQFRR
jgi:hypothetical protein